MRRPWERAAPEDRDDEEEKDRDSEDDPRIRVTFETVTEESARDGEVAERGWEDEEGEPMLDEDDPDREEVVENAVEYLTSNGATEPSSSAFHRGVWYRQTDADINYRTGAARYRSYHLVGFTAEEEREVFEELFGSTDTHSAKARAHRKWTRR